MSAYYSIFMKCTKLSISCIKAYCTIGGSLDAILEITIHCVIK